MIRVAAQATNFLSVLDSVVKLLTKASVSECCLKRRKPQIRFHIFVYWHVLTNELIRLIPPEVEVPSPS
uniref:Uncharacterized protein n=1 Tax=Solanum lycopersicum TaxID=4081 RepID=A0A3Q7HJL2_SOLLC